MAFPSRHLDVAGRPLLVRAYFTIQRHLPVYDEGLFGRGMIAISERGRWRFTEFPEIVADDLFLDSLFDRSERVLVAGATTAVATPLRTDDLVRRLVRVRRGNAALRAKAHASPGPGVRPANRTSWLRHVVLRRPWLAPAATVYVAITLYAAVLARRGPLDRHGVGAGRVLAGCGRGGGAVTAVSTSASTASDPRRDTEPGEAGYWVTATPPAGAGRVAGIRDVRISFDDGNPPMSRSGCRACRSAGCPRRSSPWPAGSTSRAASSADDLRVAPAGMRIGSHGMDHRPGAGSTTGSAAARAREARPVSPRRPAARSTRPRCRWAATTGASSAVRRLGTPVHTSDRFRARDTAWLQPRFSLRRGDTVDSVRREMLTRASPGQRAHRAAVITAKRLR